VVTAHPQLAWFVLYLPRWNGGVDPALTTNPPEATVVR
jgi:hypothetical protein